MATALLYIPDDPGIPLGEAADPYAGLDPRMAGMLRAVVESEIPDAIWLEWLVKSDEDITTFDAWVREHHPELSALVEGHAGKGKAIGTADLGGAVAGRDAALRRVSSTSSVTSHLRLGAKNIARDLAPIEEEVRKAIGLLMRMWLRGRMSYDDVQLQTARRWREAYEGVRDIGRKAAALEKLRVSSEVTREEEEWFRSAVREELRYWHVFLEEINNDRVNGTEEFLARESGGRLNARVDAYLKALRFMYEAARAYALPREALLYWMGPKKDDPEICEGCIYLMERSPFPKDRLPSVPRDGTTPCLTNCRHRIVVRMARSLVEVRNRRDALPSREVMVKELEAIKERHHGTHRQKRGRTLVREIRPGAGNPFKGEPLPESMSEALAPDILADLEVVAHAFKAIPDFDVGSQHFDFLRRPWRSLVRSVRVVGSAARGKANPNDIDLHIVWDPGSDTWDYTGPLEMRLEKAIAGKTTRKIQLLVNSVTSGGMAAVDVSAMFGIHRRESVGEAAPPLDATCETCRRAGRGAVEATTMRKGAWRVWSYLCAACAERRDEQAHDPEVVFAADIPQCPGGEGCPGGPGHEDHEAAAEPKAGVVKGKPALINKPFDFRHEPHAPNSRSMAKVDPTGYHGQHTPPGAKVILAARETASITEAAFDSPAYRNTDLMQVAQALASASKQRPLNGALIARLVDRLAAAAELTVLAARGRGDATRFSSLLRAALASIEDGLEVRVEAVGSDDLRRPVARLRALVVDCRAEQVSDVFSSSRGDGGLRPHHRRPGRARFIGNDPEPLGPCLPGD